MTLNVKSIEENSDTTDDGNVFHWRTVIIAGSGFLIDAYDM
jgi:hypothetical protein